MIKNSSQLSENKIQNTIVENFDEIAPFYYKLLSEWTNSSYETFQDIDKYLICLLYTSPSPRDRTRSRMPSSA